MNDHNSIKEEVVNGIFALLTNWWVWVCITIMVGFSTGALNKHNIFVILHKIIGLFN